MNRIKGITVERDQSVITVGIKAVPASGKSKRVTAVLVDLTHEEALALALELSRASGRARLCAESDGLATAQRHGEGDLCPQCHDTGGHKSGCERGTEP